MTKPLSPHRKAPSNLIVEIGNRWHEDYHDRALNAALKAKPENVKKGAEILSKQLNNYNQKANFHQSLALGLLDKHQVKRQSDIADAHDRYRAIHHSNMTDHFRRKEAAAYWAHSGLKKAAKQRGLLKDDLEKGHRAPFKESLEANRLEETQMLKSRGGYMPDAWWSAKDAMKNKGAPEIKALRDKVRSRLSQAEVAHRDAKAEEERVFRQLHQKHGEDFYEKPESNYGLEHYHAEKKAYAAHRRFHTLRAIEYGLSRAHDEAMTQTSKSLAKKQGGFSE